MAISFSRVRAFIRWLKANPLITLLGIVATLFGVLKGAPPAWNATTQMIGSPNCLTYGNLYHYPTGFFQRTEINWTEHGDDGAIMKFRELHRDREYIVLLNLTQRAGRNSPMILRIPVCGGTMQWSYENPQQWIDLYNVWR
jgi:hypothetical protein